MYSIFYFCFFITYNYRCVILSLINWHFLYIYYTVSHLEKTFTLTDLFTNNVLDNLHFNNLILYCPIYCIIYGIWSLRCFQTAHHTFTCTYDHCVFCNPRQWFFSSLYLEKLRHERHWLHHWLPHMTHLPKNT